MKLPRLVGVGFLWLAGVLAAASVLSGCAVSRPDLSREKWKVRFYEGVEKEDAIAAAREAIRLSDPDDIVFQRAADGFDAVRRQVSYYVVESGLDQFLFDVSAREKDNGVEVRLDIRENIQRANFYSLGLPVITVGKPQTPYVYDLFFSRMEYLLELKDKWQTCKDIGAASDEAAESIGVAAFCGRFASDLSPPPRY